MNTKEKEKSVRTTAPSAVSPAAQAGKKEKKATVDFAFGRENYRIMLIGLALIVLGFALMTGGGSENPNVWNPDIFSFRRITLAPVLVILGFVIEVFAIIKKAKD